jgi:hypothetical protein
VNQFKIGKATVRVHGSPDPDKLREVTMTFLKKAEQQRKKAKK